MVVACLALQFALVAAFLKLPWIKGWVLGLNEAMLGLERATEAGTAFVFGYLGGGPLPFPGRTRSELRAGLPRVAAHPGGERAVVAALLLARLAVHRARALAGSWKRPWGSAVPWDCPPRRTCSSAWWRRRSWCGLTSAP
ncbi:MAG: hypothetical protein M3461_22855 [Pseudomonadota bacterium]|nr:hypothetical protein [Pseudomonadota bacterium]